MNNGKNANTAHALAMGVLTALVFVGMTGTGAAVSGLVAEYHFDGNAQDSSGNGNHGTIYGATFTEGIIGNALSFDGVSNYFTAPINASFNSVKTQGTIVAWINYKDNYLIYEPGGSCTYGSRALMLWRFGTYNIKSQASIDCAGRILSDWRIGSQTGSVISQSLKSGQWYHIALVYDSNAVILYINGQKVKSSSLTGELGDADDKFWIGRNGNAAQPMYFNGFIDEVRIYNRALTDSEIQAEYNAVISPTPTTGSISVTTNITGASFTLTGASTYSGTGTSWSTTGAPAGTYTITYGAVTGYNAPPSETKSLPAGGSIAFSGTYTPTPTVTVTPTVTSTTVPPTTVPPTTVPPTTVVPTTVTPTLTTPALPKFRVGPSVTLRPVTDVIKENQDGIVELFMNNPSLNDVTLNVDAQVSVPAGLHVSGENFGESAGAGVVAGTFSVPPGKARTISIAIKADKSARKGSHTLQFTGLYYPDGNKDAFQPISLTYAVTVERPSEDTPTATPTPKAAGFGIILAGIGVILTLAIRRR